VNLGENKKGIQNQQGGCEVANFRVALKGILQGNSLTLSWIVPGDQGLKRFEHGAIDTCRRNVNPSTHPEKRSSGKGLALVRGGYTRFGDYQRTERT